MIIVAAVLLSILDGTRIEEAVRAAYPPRITALADQHRNYGGGLPRQRIAFETLPGGREVLAAYGDGEVGAIRVLAINELSTRVITESVLFGTGTGGDPRVELVNVDGDGAPEYVVSYPDHRGAELTYIFRRTGDAVQVISPLHCRQHDDVPYTDMLYPMFVDLDGDGRMEAVDHRTRARGAGGTDNDIDWLLIWKLVNGVYTLDVEGAPFFGEFRRADQQPAANVVDFPADITSAEMFVVNGGYLGKKGRVSSAEVRLNGAVVVAEKNFNQKIGTLRVPVRLQPSNDLSVRIAGAPDSQLIVYFAPAKKSVGPCRED